jgi:hypothetical protein
MCLESKGISDLTTGVNDSMGVVLFLSKKLGMRILQLCNIL